MTSPPKSNHVVIDWTTSSKESSFIQLGTTPTPQDNSFVQNIEPETLLSTKDILLIDIDDLPTAEPLANISSHTNKEFSFLISFEKFHVTKPHRTGFNKIYEFRRSRSFFFEIVDQLPDTNEIHLKIYTNDYHMSSTPIRYCSTSRLPNCRFQISKCLTHFFSSQRVIPKQIQDKYFNMIRKKLLERISFIKSRGQNKSQCNHMTKNFFNFSYKKYRFYFGIYQACSHLTHTFKENNIKSFCTVPSPFITNNGRKACIDHFDKLTLYHHDNMSGNSQHMTEITGKTFHAKRLFNRWKKYKNKKCFSLCQGTTFITQYQENTYNNIAKKGQNCIYKKLYSNLNHNYSTNPSTRRQQEKRFERNCRRVCNNAGIDFATASREELHLASLHKSFLMIKSDQLQKPLIHLKYRKKFAFPFPEDYDFPILTLTLLVIPEPIEDKPQPPVSASSLDLSKVPDDLIGYIPDHPVYKDLQGEKALIELEILTIPLTSNTKKKKVDKLKDKIRKLSPQFDKILSSLPSLKTIPYYITEEKRALELRPNKRTVDINRNLDSLLLSQPIKRARTSDSSESRIDTSSTLSG
ncbi:hypothetical protein C1646_743162 [Rhizophagus diaphanus]|nr:hypothetical protein C1646_743162 [Rhizophagus diaphanus] [Rhizophagus sp. MUCL 43196]